MSRWLAVVCEAPADQRTACALADRVFCAEADWITEEVLDDYRRWRGHTEAHTHLTWREVAHLARAANIRVHGHFEGEPGAPDAQAARRALLLLKQCPGNLHGILLIRDDDRQTERRRGLEQARGAVHLEVPVVIGLAHPKRECWVLAGFLPCNEEEEARLRQLRQELGSHPCERAEELTAKEEQAKRSAKRVLTLLSNGTEERELDCLRVELRLLEQRGQNTGLAEFLAEIRSRLVPLFA